MVFKTEEIYRRGPWKGLEDVEFATLDWRGGPPTVACSHRDHQGRTVARHRGLRNHTETESLDHGRERSGIAHHRPNPPPMRANLHVVAFDVEPAGP